MDMESQQHQVGLGGMFATGTMDRTTLARLEWLELEPGPLELESWLQPFDVEESFLDDEELEYLQKLHRSKWTCRLVTRGSALTLLRWPGFTRFPCTLWQRQHPAAAAPLHCTCGTQGWPGIVTPAETDRWGLRGCRVIASTMRSTKSKSRLEISELNELWTCYCYRFSIWFWIIFRITSDLAGPRRIPLVVTNPPWTSSLASQNVRHLRSPSPWPARLWSWSKFGTLGPQHSTRVQQNLIAFSKLTIMQILKLKRGWTSSETHHTHFLNSSYTAVKEFPLLLQLEVEWQLFQYFAKLKLRCVLMHAHIQSWSLPCGMKPRLWHGTRLIAALAKATSTWPAGQIWHTWIWATTARGSQWYSNLLLAVALVMCCQYCSRGFASAGQELLNKFSTTCRLRHLRLWVKTWKMLGLAGLNMTVDLARAQSQYFLFRTGCWMNKTVSSTACKVRVRGAFTDR